MSQFNTLFQSTVKFLGIDSLTVAEIEESLEASYLAQNPVNDSRVVALTKDIRKQGALYQHPKLVYVKSDDAWILAGGRHRLHAVATICKDFAVNAAGKLVELDDDNDSVNLEVDAIEPMVDVLKFEVPNRKELVQFLQSDNGSRSMTTQEKQEGKEYASTMTPLESLKVSLGKRIHALLGDTPLSFDAGDDGLKSVVVTKETCRQIAVKLASAAKAKFKYCNSADLDTLANTYVAFLKDNSESFSSEFARNGYKDSVEDFATVEYEGEMYDAEGELMEDVTWLQYFTSTITTPTKGKKSKAAELSDKLAAMAAKLAELGVDTSDL